MEKKTRMYNWASGQTSTNPHSPLTNLLEEIFKQTKFTFFKKAFN